MSMERQGIRRGVKRAQSMVGSTCLQSLRWPSSHYWSAPAAYFNESLSLRGQAAFLEFRLFATIAEFSLLAVIHVVRCISCSEGKLDDRNSCSPDSVRTSFSKRPPQPFLISLLQSSQPPLTPSTPHYTSFRSGLKAPLRTQPSTSLT